MRPMFVRIFEVSAIRWRKVNAGLRAEIYSITEGDVQRRAEEHLQIFVRHKQPRQTPRFQVQL
jgi:hypothetical protein